MQLSFTLCDILDVTRPQKQNSDGVWVSLAALGSCQLHFDNISWQCLLACRWFNLCFNKQQIFGRFPRKQTWPAVECCSSSAVDLRFCWSVPRSGAVSGWSLLLFCQKATKETEQKTARLLHLGGSEPFFCSLPPTASQSGCVHLRSIERARYATKHLRDTDSDYVMEKPSRCWLGAVPRYWKVVASCFQIVCFAENTSVPLAPRARISQPILLLFFCFLALEFVYKTVSQIFFIPSQTLVAFKRRRNWLKRGCFRTFRNI